MTVKKKPQSKKQTLTMIASVILATVTLFILGSMGLSVKHENIAIRQEINKILIPDKEVYTKSMSTEEVKTYKETLQKHLDEFLSDTMNKGYENYNQGRKFLNIVFFTSSSGLRTNNANTHDELVNYYKDFSYTIDDISGQYKGKKVRLLVKINVKYKGETVNEGSLYLFSLDSKGNIIGGTYYAK